MGNSLWRTGYDVHWKVAWDQAPQWEKMATKGVKKGAEWLPGDGKRAATLSLPRLPLGSRCSPSFFFRHADFFSPFSPQCGAWSQANWKATVGNLSRIVIKNC